ncbi:MAG: hypothetical protein MUE44_18070 [Oscillatoriaceae cyanobacterium Prado104]|nr:hypothetical protein [Oscillatoriaceae cyanobacterium Prado104]
MIPKELTYRDRLLPWHLIRHLPNCQRITVARFARRPDAESYLYALCRLMPEVSHTIVFVNVLCASETSIPIPMQLSIER